MLSKERESRISREHFNKYDALAKGLGLESVKGLVPFKKERIVKALKEGDSHLNSLPLKQWDNVDAMMRYLVHQCTTPVLKELGLFISEGNHKRSFGWSLCNTVCTLKHVAKHYIADVTPPPEVD